MRQHGFWAMPRSIAGPFEKHFLARMRENTFKANFKAIDVNVPGINVITCRQG